MGKPYISVFTVFAVLTYGLFCPLTQYVPLQKNTNRRARNNKKEEGQKDKKMQQMIGEFCLLQLIYINEHFIIVHTLSQQTHQLSVTL